MKILAIRLKNLASLEGTTEINFIEEPLNSAGIFAITGSTGSGKSTILDGLCLALYGKTPRYTQAKETGIDIYDIQGSTISQGDVRGILRDGTGEGFAEVDFEGIDRLHYRATWSVRRARNKAEGSLQADTIELRNITSNIAIPGRKTETLKEIERLVGLNFEQFTRSVLLAQGDFTAFLKANKDDKSSLLEKLTGTYIYSEISKLVFEKYKLEEQDLRDLNLKREGIFILTQEEVQALSQETGNIDTQIKDFEKLILNLNNEINWYQQLSRLQTSRIAANATWVQAVDAKKDAGAREQKLKQVEQVQITRTWMDALNQTEQQRQSKSTELKVLEETIITLHQQKEQLEKILQDAETNLEKNTKVNDDAIPSLEEAKKLDTRLKEKNEQVVNAKKEAKTAKEDNSLYLIQLQNKKAEAAELLKDIEKLKIWKNENNTRQPIARNRDIIVSKLADAKKLLDSLQATSQDIEEVQGKIKEKEREKVTFETELNSKKEALQAIENAYEPVRKEWLRIPIETLELDKSTGNSTLEDAIKAQAHWKVLHSASNEFNALNNSLKSNQIESIAKENLLKETTQLLATAKTRKETSEQMLQKARLAASENVETLRFSLVAGEPCPVCGSEDHPYAIQDPRLNNVLNEIADEHSKIEHAYLSFLKQHSSLQETCVILKKTIGLQEQELVVKEKVILQLQQDWVTFTIQQECILIPDEQKSGWFDEKLQILKAKQFALQKEINAYHTTKQILETQKNNIDQLEKELAVDLNNIKDFERIVLSQHEHITHCFLEKEKTTTALSDVEKTLIPYFSSQDWIIDWKSNAELFLQQINIFAEQWNENTEKLEREIQQHSILSATLSEMEIQLKSLSEDAGKKENVLFGFENNYQELTQQRKSIFEGEHVQHVEARLKQSIETAKEILNINKIKQQELYITNTKATTQKEQLEKDIVVLNKNIATYSGLIQQWLDEYNVQSTNPLDYEKLVILLSSANDWIDTERVVLKDIDDDVMKALTVLNERIQLLEQHEQKRLSDKPLDEVNELHGSAKFGLETASRSKNEISFRLQQDEENKKKIGDLLKTIETRACIAETWSKLNEIIGSADGKKFRQIAQEYTLDVLLGYANIHLEVLTSRYKIQRIPSSLGLQVVDQDMGDEVRTVYSLSGGESFLVSLALALGLASLSSSRMKVESLFIDEGFGSLDPTTLNIAMDALERLHNQGRKVGVISHVQEMTERIPTQIKVSKMANGKSKVEVLGI